MTDESPVPAQEQKVVIVSRRDHPVRVKLKPAPGDPEKGNYIMIPPRGRSRKIAQSRLDVVPPTVVAVPAT